MGWVWWAVALSPIALGAMAAAGLAVAGAPLGNASLLQRAFADRAWVLSMFVASLAYGVGEEPGWRGFALPHLQRSRSACRATVLLSLGWGLWHVPYFFYRYHLAGPGEYVGFYLGLFAGALWLTFLYNSTGGSVLIVLIWHTVWNAVAAITGVISPSLVALTAALILISGFAAVAVGGPQRMSWTRRQKLAPTTPLVI